MRHWNKELRMNRLFDASGKTLLYYPAAKAGSAYIVPEGTARIGENAFYGALGLRSVTLSSTVVRIGDAAFYGCENLTIALRA